MWIFHTILTVLHIGLSARRWKFLCTFLTFCGAEFWSDHFLFFLVNYRFYKILCSSALDMSICMASCISFTQYPSMMPVTFPMLSLSKSHTKIKLVIAQDYVPMLAIRLLGTACFKSPCSNTVTTKDTINVENITSCLVRQQLVWWNNLHKKARGSKFCSLNVILQPNTQRKNGTFGESFCHTTLIVNWLACVFFLKKCTLPTLI